MRTDINKINEHTPHTGLTEGMQVFAAGTSKYFKTGEWRNNTPVYLEDNCKQCLSGQFHSGQRSETRSL